ncbi:MAG: hypothetical protein EPO36_10495 [Chloroflexota bacterium]|nr:MAG: hypothetical protein EPO36_10495 [Chloroflexota bacterium]
MTKGTRNRRQAPETTPRPQATLRDHLPPGGGNGHRTQVPDRPQPPSRPPAIDDRAPDAARGRETRGEVETATMRYLEESEQGPK